MFVEIKLLNNFPKLLTYQVPEHLALKIMPGMLVQVPLQNRVESGMVMQIVQAKEFGFAIKEIKGIYHMPDDVSFLSFLKKLAAYYHISDIDFLYRLKSFLSQEAQQEEVSLHAPEKNVMHVLTHEQEIAYQAIVQDVINKTYKTTCLQGVTGSGKTEVYKHLIQATLQQQKSVILLLPEVSLAMRFEHLLKAAFPDYALFGFHSGTLGSIKKQVWNNLLQEKPCIIIGVHLPILLPIKNLGLIIVDEEHESGYQEKKHPRIHTRDAAILRAHHYQIPIVLGSATPSFSTLWNVKHKGWNYFELKQRFSGNFPHIQIVNLHDKKQRRNFWISDVLYKAMQERLLRKEQIIIFINRRGFSFFVQCKTCGLIPTCNQCSVSLTLHNNEQLLCHYCGHTKYFESHCWECKKDEAVFLKKGVGTEQVVQIIEKLFPSAKIARADMDTTSQKKAWQKTVENFAQGNIDILVGTQTVTKGYHFPGVTLVGILWADLHFHFPFYNAAETAFAQLIQVAGRAGRQSDQSVVIVQTLTTHNIFSMLDERNYNIFYEQELQNRILLGYPPAQYLAEIEIIGSDEMQVELDAKKVLEILHDVTQKNSLHVQILGPVPALVYRIKNKWNQKIYIKAAQNKNLHILYAAIDQSLLASSLYFTPNPIS